MRPTPARELAESGYPTPSSRCTTLFNGLIEAALAGLVLFTVFAFGGVYEWGRLGLVVGATALLGLWLGRWALDCSAGPRFTWAYLPVAGYMGLAALQLAPWPTEAAGGLAPGAVILRADLLEALPAEANEGVKTASISLYPLATRQQLATVLALAAVFFVVVNVYRRPGSIQRLLALITIAGVGVALLGLMQQSGLVGELGGYFTDAEGGAQRGPFGNKNHFAHFLNVTLGASVGLMLMRWQQSPAPTDNRSLFRAAALARWLWDRVALVAVAVAALAMAVTNMLAMSRGAVIALAVAALMVGGVLVMRHRGRDEALILPLGGLAVLVALLVGGFESVYQRMATTTDPLASGVRGRIVGDVLAAWPNFPLLGSGLGTFEMVYPQFRTGGISRYVAMHAENEYAQLLLETGLLGLGMIVAFLVIVAGAILRLWKRPSEPCHWSAYGLGLGVIAVLVHSTVDFGQHVPGIALVTAVSCGLLVAMDAQRRSQAAETCTPPTSGTRSASLCRNMRRHGRGWCLVGTLVAVPLLSWALQEANAGRLAEAKWRYAQALNKQESQYEETSEERFERLMQRMDAAIAHQPANAKNHYRQLVHRWLHWQRRVRQGPLAEVERSEAVRMLEQLERLPLLAPTYGLPYLLAGQIRWQALGEDQVARRLIEQGRALAPHRPEGHLVAGVLAAHQQRWDESVQALRAGEADLDTATRIYLQMVNRPDLAIDLYEEQPRQLLRLAARLAEDSTHRAWAAQAEAQAWAGYEARAQAGKLDDQGWLRLARHRRESGRTEAAVEAYRRALSRHYEQVGWRLELAELLLEAGQAEQAQQEAQVVRRLQPGSSEALRLIEAAREMGR